VRTGGGGEVSGASIIDLVVTIIASEPLGRAVTFAARPTIEDDPRHAP
jgi:hypothetical protein